MNQHTAGPWKFGGINSRHIYGVDNRAVCTLRAFDDQFYPDPERMRADAALIAAAPELLEACRRLTGDYRMMADAVQTKSSIDFANAAIEKAGWK